MTCWQSLLAKFGADLCADVLLQGYVQFVMTEVHSKLHSAATQEYSADASICYLPFEQVQRLSLRRDDLMQVRG